MEQELQQPEVQSQPPDNRKKLIIVGIIIALLVASAVSAAGLYFFVFNKAEPEEDVAEEEHAVEESIFVPQNAVGGWQKYRNNTFGISISLPPEFDRTYEGVGNKSFHLDNKNGDLTIAKFGVGASLLSNKDKNELLDKIKEQNALPLATETETDFSVQKKIKNSDREDCGPVIRSDSETGVRGVNVDRTILRTSCINGNIGFSISLETRSETDGEANNIDLFNKYRVDFDKALASLEFFEGIISKEITFVHPDIDEYFEIYNTITFETIPPSRKFSTFQPKTVFTQRIERDKFENFGDFTVYAVNKIVEADNSEDANSELRLSSSQIQNGIEDFWINFYIPSKTPYLQECEIGEKGCLIGLTGVYYGEPLGMSQGEVILNFTEDNYVVGELRNVLFEGTSSPVYSGIFRIKLNEVGDEKKSVWEVSGETTACPFAPETCDLTPEAEKMDLEKEISNIKNKIVFKVSDEKIVSVTSIPHIPEQKMIQIDTLVSVPRKGSYSFSIVSDQKDGPSSSGYCFADWSTNLCFTGDQRFSLEEGENTLSFLFPPPSSINFFQNYENIWNVQSSYFGKHEQWVSMLSNSLSNDSNIDGYYDLSFDITLNSISSPVERLDAGGERVGTYQYSTKTYLKKDFAL